MRLGTRILLLTLCITVGTSLVVTWIVTVQVTRYESRRASDLISLAIKQYRNHLDDDYGLVNQVIQAMLGDSNSRSLLQPADDPAGISARAQLSEEIFGRTLQAQLLESFHETAAFYALVNSAGEVVIVSAADPSVAATVKKQADRWHASDVMNGAQETNWFYAAVNGNLYLVMGFPLREQLDAAPDHAYFVGFPIDNQWVRKRLLADTLEAGSTIVPLEAEFVLDEKLVASGSSDHADSPDFQLVGQIPLRMNSTNATTLPTAQPTSFDLNGGRFIGQAFDLGEMARSGRFVLFSSLDRALIPLHQLQRSIVQTTVVACIGAFIICRFIAGMISKPIRELADATKHVAAGNFDISVPIRRTDELGALASSFNAMAGGLKDREALQQLRIKNERDLAVAREIQMNVLPQHLPVCPGYDLAANSLPAEQTGGDIYDLVTAGPGSPLVVLLADATGHGIGAALSVTQVRSMFRIGLRLGATTDDLVAQINQQLVADLGASRFVTAFVGVLDPASHDMVYHSAGQGPLLHFHAKDQRAEWLDSTALPLGIMDDARSDPPIHLHLERGDLLVLLTDGYYEHHNAQSEQFGPERVLEVVGKYQRCSAAELIDGLLRAIEQFAPGLAPLDDLTAIIIRRLE